MLATCAIDKTIALWDTRDAGSDSKPFNCGNKDMGVGKLYSVAFYQSSPWLIGCGGSGNQVSLWNLASEKAFTNRFGDRIGKAGIQPEVTEEKTEDFEAMMAANDQAAAAAEAKNKEGSQKKKGKSKKKAPRRK